jgi:hypothetical protein
LQWLDSASYPNTFQESSEGLVKEQFSGQILHSVPNPP